MLSRAFRTAAAASMLLLAAPACDVGEITAGGPGDDPEADGGGPGDTDAIPGAPDGVEPTSAPFSFFVTSIESMRMLSGSQDGFGGDLGGLAGADQICQTIGANAGAGDKTWRAFLSVANGPGGAPIHARDRVGAGPWYDRNGRVVAQDLGGLLQERPDGDVTIVSDLPNELGIPQMQFGDNHDVMTGTNELGMLDGVDPSATCNDWTSSVGPGSEGLVRTGHSWPAGSGASWMRAHRLRGCAAGVNLVQDGGGSGNCVGCSGGYGAIYCFSLEP